MAVTFCKPKLVHFYVYDSRYGQKEGEEHEKLLYYFPAGDSLNTKVRNIGLTEALANFTRKFNKKDDLDSIYSTTHRTVIYQPEEHIWIVMKISLSCYVIPAALDVETNKKKSKRRKEKKNSNTTDSTKSNIKQTEPPPSSHNVENSTDNTNVIEDSVGNLNQATADTSSINSLLSSSSQDNILDSTSDHRGVPSSTNQDNISSELGESHQVPSNLADASHQESSSHSHEPSPGAAQVPETNSTVHYDADSVKLNVLKSHLRLAYEAFTFIHQSFEHVLEKNGLKGLRSTLLDFYDDYLKKVDLTGGTVTDVWRGLSYLPLSQLKFLQVYSCLSGLRASIPSVRYTALLYTNSVAWSDFQLESLRHLLHFLNYKGVFSQLATERRNEARSSTPANGYSDSYFGGMGYSATIYVKNSVQKTMEKCQLILFKTSSILIPIVLSLNEKLTPVLHEKIYHLLSSRVNQLGELLEECKSNVSVSDGFKYIYHNEMNSAIKSTFIVDKQIPSVPIQHFDQSKSNSVWWFSKSSTPSSVSTEDLLDGAEGTDEGGAFRLGEGSSVVSVFTNKGDDVSSSIPWTVMQKILDMQSDMKRLRHHEMVIKTSDDFWVIGRRGNNRQLFVTLTQSNANLVEVSDEVTRRCSSEFYNIFMLD